MGEGQTVKRQLRVHGYQELIIKEIWKWYDSSKKKGIASF